jgi:prepilin-type N-terminal cleavage/methylation domain-containing protein
MIKKYRAFTLIELLIVIAIIAVLLTMLIPALQAAKDQARTAICGTHLKQWGAIFRYYTDANQGRFMDPLGVPENPALVNSSGQILWVEPMRRYYKGTGDKMRMCPTAKRTVAEGAEYSFAAWSINYPKFGEDEFRSSYGINNWIYNPRTTNLWGHPTRDNWRKDDQQGGSDIPLFMDCYRWGGHPDDYAPYMELSSAPAVPPPGDGMMRFCLPRHQGTINVLFMDRSVRRVPLPDLWGLKWHRTYDRTAQPPDWKWVERYR